MEKQLIHYFLLKEGLSGYWWQIKINKEDVSGIGRERISTSVRMIAAASGGMVWGIMLFIAHASSGMGQLNLPSACLGTRLPRNRSSIPLSLIMCNFPLWELAGLACRAPKKHLFDYFAAMTVHTVCVPVYGLQFQKKWHFVNTGFNGHTE